MKKRLLFFGDQKKVADKLGVSHTHVRNVASGQKRSPRVEKALDEKSKENIKSIK
jgi:DNA-binding transcriptional regulator YdaS (Cro superfamily)